MQRVDLLHENRVCVKPHKQFIEDAGVCQCFGVLSRGRVKARRHGALG